MARDRECRRRGSGYGTKQVDRRSETSAWPKELSGRTVAFLVAHEGIEQVELTEPWSAVEEAGGTPKLVSPQPGKIQAFNHLDKADTFPVDETSAAADPGDYDGLVLPGGVANPDALRMDNSAVRFIRGFFDADTPVAAICHAPWTLIEADVVRGRTMTSWPSLQTDLRNAGATWVDEEVVVDNGLVTSRNPDDLKAFCAKMVEEIAEGRHRS
ncbi:MAG TPA: type 1 glutamine amidotransferase domain-containing protein [Nocardioidaceae bacterium]|nr:type 1 glutamine amidotransferase domain-containing protein [Nocardioidaceae bacterium]